MRTTIESKKKEILAEVINLQSYCRANLLNYKDYAPSTLELKNKDDLLFMRNTLLDTAADYLINKGKGVDGAPEFKEVAEAMHKAFREASEDFDNKTKAFEKAVKEYIDEWLGKGLDIDVNTTSIEIRVPGLQPNRELRVTMYHQTKFAYNEDGMICGVEGGSIGFNQPTFGSWDPLTDNVGFDVHRFFRILNILANESQEVIPQFEKMWAAYLNERSEFNDKQEYIAEAYRANARTIAYQLLEQMNL